MKVMVTGATTPLGAALIEVLMAENEPILAIGIEDRPAREHGSLVYRRLDLTRPRILHDVLWGDARDLGIEVIVHCMSHRSSSDEGRDIHAQNVEAARELILACANHPTIRRVVYRSFADVYSLRDKATNLLDEDSPLELDPATPQWLRDRVEADMMMCSHMGRSLEIAVVRCAEILAPGVGSQLWDYLQSRVCLRPLGFDPMLNVLALEDAARALALTARSSAIGVFNIPGRDTLPLSRAIALSHRADVPIPGPLMYPLYALRRWVAGFEFRYGLNAQKFHFGGILDGSRAARELDFVPTAAVAWPR